MRKVQVFCHVPPPKKSLIWKESLTVQSPEEEEEEEEGRLRGLGGTRVRGVGFGGSGKAVCRSRNGENLDAV